MNSPTSFSLTSDSHPLDNVIWTALTTRQASLSEGNDVARRFNPAFARFAGLADANATRLDALAPVVPVSEGVAVETSVDITPSPYFDLVDVKNVVLMVGPAVGPTINPHRFTVLGPQHKSQMAALVKLTEPGPWAERTSEFGRFIGELDGDQLVAMTGERMHVPGYREISGVCTHPSWRGKGLARDLMLAVSQAIVARGEVPFLHVLAENATAIALYERLGFTEHKRCKLVVVSRSDRAVD